MEDSAGGQAPFDEQAALAELERMREQIQRYRSERKDVQAEFSRFVRSFRLQADPGSAPADTLVTEDDALRAFEHEGPDPRPIAATPRPAAPDFAPETGAARPPSAVSTLAPDPHREPPPAISLPMQRDGDRRAVERVATPSGAPAMSWTRPLVGGALILAAAGALTMWSLRDGAGEVPTAGSPAPAAEPASPATVSTTPTATAAPPARRGSEIATTRRVWMRVLVDGERILEREVPADTRVPLSAQKTIVIRTGDAGAVRLSLDGVDQGFLGREGEVVTRTFAVPAARPR